MIDPSLKRWLAPVARRQQRLQMTVRLAACWAVPAVLGLGLIALQRFGSGSSLVWIPLLALLGLGGAVAVIARHRRAAPDWRDLARRIEEQHPELDGLLLTAVQQHAGDDGGLNYLQGRVVRQALEHARAKPWTRTIPRARVALVQVTHGLALALFLVVLLGLRPRSAGGSIVAGGWKDRGVTVSPGDTSIERGHSLVVMTRFDGAVPADVDLVIEPGSGPAQRIPLVKNLADPVFGGNVPEVSSNFLYRVEYSGRSTRPFQVTVFEHPRLERADAALTFPEYSGLAPKRIENTKRLSAVEGSRLDLTLQLNKPVVAARLVANREPTNTLSLAVESGRPVATLEGLVLETNQTYQLQLVDAEGRTNRVPASFVIEVLKNREPELKLASPRGDLRPSALEEIVFEGTVWDDFGVPAYGLAYTVAGKETTFVELGQAVPGGQKRPFHHLLRLEDLGAQPDQLISWFVWADDVGPDGQVRRSTGDLFFAEVRPFDEVFREGQDGQSEAQQSGEASDRQGSPAARLVELQKQIITATWKLQRGQGVRPGRSGKAIEPPPRDEKPSNQSSVLPPPEGPRAASRRGAPVPTVFAQRAAGPPDVGSSPLMPRARPARAAGTNQTASASKYVEDLGVVREALGQALEQAEGARERQQDPRSAALWDEVLKEMKDAQAQLDKAIRSPPSLADAIAAEEAAFQALLKLQEREYSVTRSRNRRQGAGSGREQQMQRQLSQLELTQAENRYETERQAQAPQSPERREELQVMNRLRELARRQQDLNDRLQELQTALQEARTDADREEIRRRLKRLQEEEQRMLAEVDELQQRLNQPDNQSRMTEQRQQLERTREDLQRAAAAAGQGSASQALASGTRAQRQLQQMREDLRRQNAGEFADDLRRLRSDARELARRQEAVQKALDALADEGRKTLSDSAERQQGLDQLARQKSGLTNLLERATELSQQTEEAEPLVYRELYDTLRRFDQDDAKNLQEFQQDLINRGLMNRTLYDRLKQTAEQEDAKSLELTSELVRQDLLPQAREAGQRAQAGVTDLKRGVERAAEKVLGDDTEALRQARQQLEQLTDQIEREIAQGQARDGVATNATTGSPTSPAEPSEGGAAQGGEAQARSGSGQPRSDRSQLADAGKEPDARADAPSTEQGRQGRQGNADTQPEGTGRERADQQPRPGGRGQGTSSADANIPTDPGPREGAAAAGDARSRQAETNPQDRPGGAPGGGRGSRPPRAATPRNGTDAGGGPPAGWEELLDGEDRGAARGGPVITGEDFGPWSDRLREVEEMVDDPALQNQLAAGRERARLFRQEYRRDRKKPDWAVVRLQVVRPLVEVRDQIVEELARREPRNPLVPIDRDPVPNRFSELVRRYYEELGKDR
jgi:hypothetical protein